MSSRLFRHFRNYSLGSIFVTLAGLISFPILTRLLSISDYGLLSLVSVTLTLLVAIAKCGMQNSIIRFYTDARKKLGGYGLEEYYSTIIISMVIMAAFISIAWGIGSQFIPDTFIHEPELRLLFLLTSMLVFIRVMNSVFVNILRAREQSGLIAKYTIVKRYASLVLVLTTLFFISRTVYGFYVATIVTEVVAVIFIGVFSLKGVSVHQSSYSTGMMKKMMRYGIPLIGFEMSSVMLDSGDRYIVQWLLGSEKLGAYSAAYNLCEYIKVIVFISMCQAMSPVYLRMWNEDGPEKTREFIENSLRFFLLLGLPVITGMAVVGPELLTILASDKYQDGSVIIPFVLSGMFMSASTVIFGAGLFIGKQSTRLMLIMASSAVVNIILNLLLIPEFGLLGAAYATIFSYMLLLLLTRWIASKTLKIHIPWILVFKLILVCGSMYYLLVSINLSENISTMFARILAGITYYTGMIMMIDSYARQIGMKFIRKTGV